MPQLAIKRIYKDEKIIQTENIPFHEQTNGQKSFATSMDDPINRFCGSGFGGATARLLAERRTERGLFT